MSIFIALLVLSFLIFFHELGHFAVARWLGVKVEVFSIGFGKRFFTKKWGETEFSLAWIPLGGYVRMKGQDDIDPSKQSTDSDSYSAKKPWERIMILLGGPFANFLLAFLLFLIIYIAGMSELGTKVNAILPNSPAEKSGLIKGDIITSINGKPVRFFDELKEQIQSANGTVILGIKRSEQSLTLTLNTKIMDNVNEFREKIKARMIGVSPDYNYRVEVSYGLFEALGRAWEKTVWSAGMILRGIQKLIEGVVPAKEVGGIISIVDFTSKATETGIVVLLFMTALISVNLGVLNLLPIPALDGGHIMLNLYEMITRKAPSEAILVRLTVMGWILLLGLMLLGTYNDINRLVGS